MDQLGLELTGTRMHGNPDCGKSRRRWKPLENLLLGVCVHEGRTPS